MPLKIVQSGKLTITEYRTLHQWVARHLGMPKLCWDCGSTDHKRYDWANVSGEYKRDLSDWRRLCRLCHLRTHRGFLFKDKDKCGYGHPLTEENLYVNPRGWKICRTCKKRNQTEYLEGLVTKDGDRVLGADKTHCKLGHPFSGHNLIVRTRKQMVEGKAHYYKIRLCRKCVAIHSHRFNSKEKVTA